MWAIQFFVDALIVCVLCVMAGGTLIGYYFTKKAEYDSNRAKGISEVLEKMKKL